LEPWYQIDKTLAFWPVASWFNWHFEGIEHIPSSGPALIACNHASYLDPWANAYAVLKAGRRPRFMAKQELFEIPIVGRALRGAHMIPVSRGTGDRTPLVHAQRALEAGEVVLIYPEGTVTNRPDHLPMDGKTGAVRLALATGLPITPLASWGSQAVWQKSGKGSLKFGRPVWVKAGPAIDIAARRAEGPTEGTDEHASLAELTAEVIAVLTDMVIDLRERYPKRWSS
jgi:1-acyl-sn-glycerol-3-phosphate acyltransferase